MSQLTTATLKKPRHYEGRPHAIGKNKEELVALWMTTGPSARSPYALYGNPPMWLTTVLDNGLEVYTRPSRTMVQIGVGGGWQEVDGVSYQFRAKGEWVGQGYQATFDSFEMNGATFHP